MKARKNALEWIVFGTSVIVIGLTVTLLVRGASLSGEKRPDLRVETGAASPASGGFAVPVVVSNQGEATAEQARIQIALVAEGAEVEKAELTIAFVPRRSRREGWVVFERDPRCCAVTARTLAYEKP